MDTVSRGNRLAHRRGHRDRCIVEEVVREADERRLQRLVDQQTREPAAIDEEIGRDRFAFLRVHRGDRRRRRPRVACVDVAGLVAHPALERLLVQKPPEQHRVEVIAVPDVERKASPRLRRTPLGGQARGDEEPVRVREHVRRR